MQKVIVTLSLAILVFATGAVAQTSARAPNSAGERGRFARENGEIAGLRYTYSLGTDDSEAFGSIDGPLAAAGIVTGDPDRWVISEKRDRMTDRSQWYITHHQTGLMLAMSPRGAIMVACLIGADFPGRPIAIRAGNSPPHQLADNCAAPAPRLVAELSKGGSLLTRGYSWPYDYGRDRQGRAEGFAAATELFLYLRSMAGR